MTNDARRRAFLFGLDAEGQAALYLQLKGYRVLARRFRAGGAEIDLVMRRFNTIAFVEVKARATMDSAAMAMTPQKALQIARAARAWTSRNRLPQNAVLRLDAVIIAPRHWPRHLQAVFDLNM
jgi:putative endonuclease